MFFRTQLMCCFIKIYNILIKRFEIFLEGSLCFTRTMNLLNNACTKLSWREQTAFSSWTGITTDVNWFTDITTHGLIRKWPCQKSYGENAINQLFIYRICHQRKYFLTLLPGWLKNGENSLYMFSSDSWTHLNTRRLP